MVRKIISIAWRYILPLIGFALILLTAYVAEKDRRKALSAGYKIHIPKPVDPAAIATAVAAIKKKL